MKAILIAGTTSGVGKTSVATGIMGALRSSGLRVQPFKAGPDYIDPGYHSSATGKISRNLDTWMLSGNSVLELFNRAARGTDIAVIEGVMGLYDGRNATNDEGSTAELAKLLRVPVLLVVDSRKGARSLAAMVKGYRDFDTGVNLAGVILNGIGSDLHLDLCKDAIEHYTGIPVVGHLPSRPDLALPERHLGLVTTAERPPGDEFMESLISQCLSTLDITAILRIAGQAAVPRIEPTLFPPVKVAEITKIGIARDRAFSFYYQDSLDLLEDWGAGIVDFSPLSDLQVPDGICGLYIGGGFPEVYAAELASNSSMISSLRAAAQRGMPIYAECGGLMYLCESVHDFEGQEHRMANIIPVKVRIDTPRLSLGYRTVRALEDGPLLLRGETVRGHEFHWSVICEAGKGVNAYEVAETERREGFHIGNTLASYIHLHMAAAPGMAQRFIETCRSWRSSQR